MESTASSGTLILALVTSPDESRYVPLLLIFVRTTVFPDYMMQSSEIQVVKYIMLAANCIYNFSEYT